MIVIGQIEPLINRQDNAIEMYNSFSILLLTYCLLCLTQFVPDANARYQVGFGMIGLTGQNILVNIYIVGRQPVRELFLRCRAKWIHRDIVKKNIKHKLTRISTRK